MPAYLSPLESLPPTVLSCIGLHAAENSFLGTPDDLLALSLTSHTLHNALSSSTNKHLWGELFEFKFDIEAADRRLGDRWTTSGCLAQEANKRFAAMSRIRRGIVSGEHHKSDLWTAYLMMLESDGNNERQLIEWANIQRYLYIVMFYRASAPKGHPCSWFFDTEGTALVLWLQWMTACPGKLSPHDLPLLPNSDSPGANRGHQKRTSPTPTASSCLTSSICRRGVSCKYFPLLDTEDHPF